jgi:putative peptidoglycan lipid II flippase
MTDVHDPLARKIATVGTATLLSRLFGFVRDLGIAALLGAGPISDAYFAALLIPNLFRRLLAEGALNASFVPMWLRVRAEGGSAATQRFGQEVLGTMLVGFGSVALVCSLIAPMVIRLVAPGFDLGDVRFELAISYFRIAIPYVAIAAAVAAAAAALNAEGRVAAVSYGLLVYNLVAIAAVGLVAVGGLYASAGVILSASVVVAGIAQSFVIGAALLRLPAPPVHPRLMRSSETRQFFAAALPGVIAAGIPQLKLLVGTIVASPSASAVSWLYYTYRLYELPLGVISVAIASVMTPAIAASLHSNQDAAGQAQSRSFEIALGLALPAAIGLSALAEPITAGLFQHGAFQARDTAAVAMALATIAIGLPGHALEKVFGSIAFARGDTRAPMLAALLGLGVAVTACLLLFPSFGHVGVAAAIAASGWVGAAVLGALLMRRRWLNVDPRLAQRLARIITVAIAMGATVLALRMLLAAAVGTPQTAPGRLAVLALLVAAGLNVYLFGLQLLGVLRVRDLFAFAAVRRKA